MPSLSQLYLHSTNLHSLKLYLTLPNLSSLSHSQPYLLSLFPLSQATPYLISLLSLKHHLTYYLSFLSNYTLPNLYFGPTTGHCRIDNLCDWLGWSKVRPKEAKHVEGRAVATIGLRSCTTGEIHLGSLQEKQFARAQTIFMVNKRPENGPANLSPSIESYRVYICRALIFHFH